jgi:hypothetical protein
MAGRRSKLHLMPGRKRLPCPPPITPEKLIERTASATPVKCDD